MLTLLAIALAQDQPPQSEREVDVGAPRFVLVVEDLARTLKGREVTAVVGDRTYALRDDGTTPDPVPDDGLYAANIDSQPREQVMVRIATGEDLVDEQQVTLAADLVLASVRVDITDQGVKWRVQEDRPVNTGNGGVTINNNSVTTATVGGTTPDNWTMESDRPPALTGTATSQEHSVAAGVGLALAALVSGVLVLRSREDDPAQSQGSAPGEATGDTASVVRELAATTNVLLVPRPDQRPRLALHLVDVPAVMWLDQDRPNPHAVARAARHLAEHGPVAVVVEGAGALEKPGEKESTEAALEELRELAEWSLTVTS